MNKGAKHIYEFEQFRLDEAKRLLVKSDGEAVALMPKAFDILAFLVERAGEVVEKDDLMAAIWPDTIVEENNLTQNISNLRRVLGEKHRENRFIATVPGRGYKFVADVRRVDDAVTPANLVEMSSKGEQKVGLTRNENPVSAVSGVDPTTENDLTSSEPRPRRRWFLALAVLSIIGLSSMGFLYWKERSGGSDAKVR